MKNAAHFVFGIFGKRVLMFFNFTTSALVSLMIALFLCNRQRLCSVSLLGTTVSFFSSFKRILKHRSTEQFSGIPYVMTLLNCLLSASNRYGLPFVSPNNLLVSTVNGTGAAIESVYVLIFLVFAPKKEKAKISGLLALVLSVFSVVAFVSLFALHENGRKLFCGVAMAVFSIIMYGSPLTIIRLVIKTKSVEYMPFFLSLFVFLCGTSWFVFGLIGRDAFVAVSYYVPNGFGSGLGAVQLILYAIYRNNKGESKKPQSEESMEMGKKQHVGPHNENLPDDKNNHVPQDEQV